MVDKEYYGGGGNREKRRLILGPGPERYFLHLSPSKYKDRRGAQGWFGQAVEVPPHLEPSPGEGVPQIAEVVCVLFKPNNFQLPLGEDYLIIQRIQGVALQWW